MAFDILTGILSGILSGNLFDDLFGILFCIFLGVVLGPGESQRAGKRPSPIAGWEKTYWRESFRMWNYVAPDDGRFRM